VKDVFAFLRTSGDPILEREFRALYQEPNVRYAMFGTLLAVVGFGGFHLMDVAAGRVPALDWAGAARFALTSIFVLATYIVFRYQDFVTRFYTPLANVFFLVAAHGAALLPIAVYGVESPVELYWSLNASLVTATIVIYGFSRLTARNTALVVFSGYATGLATAALSPGFDLYYFGRLALHLAIVNVASFSLRQSIERRERQLFLLARENLRRNIYAQELEAARTQAVEADRVKMRFLANMSHEFRTPMSGVVQTLEVVRRTATGETAKLVARAIDSSNAFLGTINSILDYTRWSQDVVPVSISTVGLGGLVRRVVARHSAEISRRGLALHLRLDLTDSEDFVKTDAVMLAEVLGRLLANAVKFTPAGRIDLGVELRRRPEAGPTGVSIEASVVDTGIGIPDAVRSRLGTAFYQVDNASNRKEGGTGLGLAIVEKLVSALGGSWSLSSVEGSGTEIRLTVPAELASAHEGAALRGSFRALDFRHREIEQLRGSVLLVEDNELNAALAQDLLGLMGLEVVLACDGQQAIEVAAAKDFDLILMDCRMPVLDGYAATRAIRLEERQRGTRRIPIVAVTANALAGDREVCLDAGMDDHLAKPYTAAQLREVLATWLPAPKQPEVQALREAH